MPGEPVEVSASVDLSLPKAARDFGSEAFRLTLMQELLTQMDQLEPHLMCVAGGWLCGPVDVYVTSVDAPSDAAIVGILLQLRFQTQVVPGCGTSAVASAHQVAARLRLERSTGRGRLEMTQLEMTQSESADTAF